MELEAQEGSSIPPVFRGPIVITVQPQGTSFYMLRT